MYFPENVLQQPNTALITNLYPWAGKEKDQFSINCNKEVA